MATEQQLTREPGYYWADCGKNLENRDIVFWNGTAWVFTGDPIKYRGGFVDGFFKVISERLQPPIN